jgi:hypothetical protein
MGYMGETWHVSVVLDAHGGDKERDHDALWRELQVRLIAVCREERYAQLAPDCDEPENVDVETLMARMLPWSLMAMLLVKEYAKHRETARCTHQSSMLTYCILAPGHDGQHVYRDASGTYYEIEEEIRRPGNGM